jgi:hypothetical protein
MDEAGMRALQRAKKVFVTRMKSGELCPLPVATTTAWMQEVERSRMPEPKASHSGIDIHHTVGGASAAMLSKASSKNSHSKRRMKKCYPHYVMQLNVDR